MNTISQEQLIRNFKLCMMEKLIFSSVLGPLFNREFPQEEISCGTLNVNCIALKTNSL